MATGNVRPRRKCNGNPLVVVVWRKVAQRSAGQMGDTVSEGVRLARSGAGDDQQRCPDMAVATDAVLDGSALLRRDGSRRANHRYGLRGGR